MTQTNYSVSLECYIDGALESRSVDLNTTAEFIENNLYNKDFMIRFLESRLKCKIFSYGVKNITCTKVYLLEQKLDQTSKLFTQIQRRLTELEEKIDQLTMGKGKEKIDVPPKIEEITKTKSIELD